MQNTSCNPSTADVMEMDVDENETKFNRAADYLQHLVDKLEAKTLLEFYGLYKQSTVGRCNTPKPGIFSMQARAKWNAWNDLGSLSKEAAMRAYISKLNDIEPDWDQSDSSSTTSKGKKSHWVSVSTPIALDGDDCNSTLEKTFIDHVKEGNVDEILAFFSRSLSIGPDQKQTDGTVIINEFDANGLGAIHWVADRGHSNILELLLMNGANVNLVDKDAGQTALHYAVSCGHLECVKLLIKYGADRSIADVDGATCVDLAIEANDLTILEILKS